MYRLIQRSFIGHWTSASFPPISKGRADSRRSLEGGANLHGQAYTDASTDGGSPPQPRAGDAGSLEDAAIEGQAELTSAAPGVALWP